MTSRAAPARAWVHVGVLVVLLLVASACAGSPAQQGNAIRVRNDSGAVVRDVFVEGFSFGTLAPGELTEYEPMGTLYEVLWCSGFLDGTEFGGTPIDRPGEDPEVEGWLTVVVYTTEKDGEVKLAMALEEPS